MQTEKILYDLETVENDIVTLENALQRNGLKDLSGEVKTFHNEFIKLIKRIEKAI